MSAVPIATLAGLCFGALAVAVRWALGRGADPTLAATAVAAALALAAAAGSIASDGVDPGQLWPFFAVGLVAPGASQICLTQAVRLAGPSRAAVLMGTAPMLSIAIALTLLGEPFHLLLVAGTTLIVAGGVALARERRRPEHFRVRGAVLALVCAGLFAARDNLLRLGARDVHPPALQAAAATLLAATLCIAVYLVSTGSLRALRPALLASAPAGLALAGGYAALLGAYGHGRVSIVAPLNATGSLWAVVLAAVVVGRTEMIGRRVVAAGLLVVTGGALIGVHG